MIKLRKLPSSIPVYTWKGYKDYAMNSVDGNITIGIIVVMCSILVYIPAWLWYSIVYTMKCTWDVVRYCTYSLNDKEEAVVAMMLRNKEEQL